MRCSIFRTMVVVLVLSLASSSFAFQIANRDGRKHTLTFDSALKKGITVLTIPARREADQMTISPRPVRVTLSATGETVALPSNLTSLTIKSNKLILDPPPKKKSPARSESADASRKEAGAKSPARKPPKPSAPAETAATFMKGRWQSVYIQFIEFEVSGNNITGGRYRWRKDGLTGTITGGQVNGRKATYKWRDKRYSGSGTLELLSDGTLLYTDASDGATARYYR